MVNLFMLKEAIASVALDKDPEYETVSEGLTNNPKLYSVKMKLVHRHTGDVVWRGSLANVTQSLQRLDGRIEK